MELVLTWQHVPRINIPASKGKEFSAYFYLCSPTQTYKYSKANVNTVAKQIRKSVHTLNFSALRRMKYPDQLAKDNTMIKAPPYFTKHFHTNDLI